MATASRDAFASVTPHPARPWPDPHREHFLGGEITNLLAKAYRTLTARPSAPEGATGRVVDFNPVGVERTGGPKIYSIDVAWDFSGYPSKRDVFSRLDLFEILTTGPHRGSRAMVPIDHVDGGPLCDQSGAVVRWSP